MEDKELGCSLLKYMIRVSFWSENKQAYFCQWEVDSSLHSAFLTGSDLDYEEKNGEEIVWECN